MPPYLPGRGRAVTASGSRASAEGMSERGEMMSDRTGRTLQSSMVEDTVSEEYSVVQDGGEMLELMPNYFLVEGAMLDEGCEDGFSLSRRSVLTEKLLPARWSPVRRKRARRESPVRPSFESLPV